MALALLPCVLRLLLLGHVILMIIMLCLGHLLILWDVTL